MRQKFFAALAALTALALLAGCAQPAAPSAAPQSAPASSVSQSAPESLSSAAPKPSSAAPSSSAPAEASSAAQEAQAWAQEDVRALAEALAAYEPGTAGASLKAAVAACAVLDLAEERGAPADEDALAQEAAQALEALGEEAAQRAAEGWPDVRAVCGQLLEEGGVQAASGLLADAGEPNAHDAYTPARCEPVLRALDAALGA